MTDREMLKMLVEKWIEPLDAESSNKTIGAWRREFSQLMTIAITHVKTTGETPE